jgi:RNA recognition motif-containing protein
MGAERIRVKAAKPLSGGALILRNLPETLTRSDLIASLAERGRLTGLLFLYLPIDAANRKSLGYAFLCFADVAVAEGFRVRMQGVELRAGQPLQVSWNSTGGNVEDQVARFRDSTLMHPSMSDESRPVLLQDGVRVEFPAPTKKIRAPRQRDQQRLIARTRKQQAARSSDVDS